MTNSEKAGRALNIDVALMFVDGDRKFLAELAALFLQDYPHLIGDARDAILKGDHSRLERAAHTLKGRLAFFGIQKAREPLSELETMGRLNNLANAGQMLAQVETEMESVLPEFESLAQEQSQ